MVGDTMRSRTLHSIRKSVSVLLRHGEGWGVLRKGLVRWSVGKGLVCKTKGVIRSADGEAAA